MTQIQLKFCSTLSIYYWQETAILNFSLNQG